MEAERAVAGICYVCKNTLFQDESFLWVYHESVGLVCKRHPGVIDWHRDIVNQQFEQWMLETKNKFNGAGT